MRDIEKEKAMADKSMNPSTVVKVDMDPVHESAKCVWIRLDAIKAAEIKDGYARITITDYFGGEEPKSW